MFVDQRLVFFFRKDRCKAKKGTYARGSGSLRKQARMRKTEKPGRFVSLHF
jgi:hypothetical protein